ncbi:MAG: hypothetical protein NC203_00275 [Firmicutes bacterium]|nr:hypothetical protein [Bacillota bacterium]
MANEKLASLNQLKAMGEAAKASIDAVKASVPTKVSALNNDNGYQTAEDVEAAVASQIGRVYKPAGSKHFNDLYEPSEEILGNVYNITSSFVTDERFVDGAGVNYPDGTNIAVVQVGNKYCYDVLSGAVDLSNYVEKEAGKTLSSNDFSDIYKAMLDDMPEGGVSKVETSDINGYIKINGVDTPVVDIATDAEAEAVIEAIFPAE